MASLPSKKPRVLLESISDSSSDEEDNFITREPRGWALKRHKQSDNQPNKSHSETLSLRSDEALVPSASLTSRKHIEPREPSPPSPVPSTEPPFFFENQIEDEIPIDNSEVEVIKELPRFNRMRAISDESLLLRSDIESVNAPYKHPINPIPYNADEQIPLRKRAYSDLNERNVELSKSSKLVERETPERWRGRLWPGKAIITYCRVITRCQPPKFVAGEKIKLAKGRSELVPHWKSSDVGKIGTSFPSLNAHSTSFFLLTVEESRDAVLKSDDDSSDRYSSEKEVETAEEGNGNGPSGPNSNPASSSSSSAPANTDSSNGWIECEVLNIVAESEFGSMRSAYDVRLGSVWVVKVAIRTPNVTLDENKPSFSRDSSLAGGDLMVLQSPDWSKALLGIVQPWDPDYDVKYGINFQVSPLVQQSILAESVAAGEAGNLTTANILVCIDGGDNVGRENTGGWATPGTIFPGVVFRMSLLGNVMTYVRECQALMSLKLLHPTLRDAVLNQEGRHETCYVTDTCPPGEAGPFNVPPRLWGGLEKSYNASQLRALRMVCKRDPVEDLPASPVCLLQGPPGTGKTKTILGILSVFLSGALRPSFKATKVIAGSSFRTESRLGRITEEGEEMRRGRADSLGGTGEGRDRPRILVCAPSNTAVDELVYRILTQGVLGPDGHRIDDLNVVRIGHAIKDEYLKRSRGMNYRASLSEQEHHLLRIVERVSLDHIVQDRRSRIDASEGRKQLGLHFRYSDLRKQVLERADVVACTLSGAGSQPILEVVLRITGFKFDAVIIDEAAQAVEPSSLIPFKYNPQLVVMVGDPCQLPATVFSKLCKEANYSQSLFQRLQRSGLPVAMLETQYRMHPMIAEFPSMRYYNKFLVTDAHIAATIPNSKHYYEDKCQLFKPVVFHDIAYGREKMEGFSMFNFAEARYVVDLFTALLKDYPNEGVNIGIIAPYRAQRKFIMRLLKETLGSKVYSKLDTEISTVDGFQGREKDIIIFSCVRAPSKNTSSKPPSDREGAGIGFLKEWQRLNVAITRARYALWIVGHMQTLQRDQEWDALIQFVRSKQAVVTMTQERSLKDCLARRSEGVHGGQGGGKKSGKKNKKKRRDWESDERRSEHRSHHSHSNSGRDLERRYHDERDRNRNVERDGGRGRGSDREREEVWGLDRQKGQALDTVVVVESEASNNETV